jgi:hypothetical protein
MSTFEFTPRPEAKAMKWNHLIPPVQSAVRGLLVNLAGAVRQSCQKELEVASCFLINGERGTGKTSVLLNARRAVEEPEKFFLDLDRDGEIVGKRKKNLSGSEILLIPLKDEYLSDGSEGQSEREQRYVLSLHAQYQENPFFYSEASYPITDDTGRDAIECAKTIKDHAVWLDVLDLEPLQSDANLLTTVLTRIREALSQFNGQDQEQEITSLFEANPDSARPLLDQLISDATLMWENIKEPDTRNMANRQVAAAGIYAKFKNLFRKAMDKLTEELGRPYGKNISRSIILPIDNIDRSIEHLNNIVKLTQLISHPHLWLVMAGGREDIDTFLARVFWKELTRNTGTPWADGKGEEQTLTMARRQAAATSQKIWPSSHRIVVDLMQPVETLAFCPLGKDTVGSIEHLLRQVKMPTWLAQNGKAYEIPLFDLFEHDNQRFDVSDVKDKEGLLIKIKQSTPIYQEIYKILIDKLNDDEKLLINKPNLRQLEEKDSKILARVVANIIGTLNDFLYSKDINYFARFKKPDWVSKILAKDDNENYNYPRFVKKVLLQDAFSNELTRPFTFAAQNGLRLPARNVLELWQIAHWVVNDKTHFSKNSQRPEAEQIARTMLRNAIQESNVSSHLSRHLQEDIIRNDVNGGTLLNFREIGLEVECIAPNDTELKLANDKASQGLIQSRIRIKRGSQSFLRFKLIENSNGEDGHNKAGELPEFVAAWLVVLYDVLMFAERLAVLHAATIPPPKIATSHAMAIKTQNRGWHNFKEELPWPVPEWSSFVAHSLFWRHWKIFQRNLDQALNLYEEEKRGDYRGDWLSQYLAIGWQHCVLETYDDLHRCENDNKDTIIHELMAFIKNKFELKLPNDSDQLDSLRYLVLLQASLIYDCVTECVKKPHRLRNRFNSQEMLEWLEKALPMMFSYWYVPATPLTCSLELDNFKKNLPEKCKDEFKKLILIGNNTAIGKELEIIQKAVGELTLAWDSNIKFMVSTMDDKVAEIFKPKDKENITDEQFRQYIHHEFMENLKGLCCLHTSLPEDQPKPGQSSQTNTGPSLATPA